jgi:protein SCO1
MKSLKLPIFLFTTVGLIAVLTAAAIHRNGQKISVQARSAEKRFEVRGQIRGLESDGKTVRIAHEEIPGYMAAMTMALEVKNPVLLRNLQVGDEIGFQLVVTDEDSWISRIDRLSSRPASAGADVAATTLKEMQRVQPGETVPDFALLDQNGRTVRLKALRGKAVLLTFIYTRCPLPNYCPLMSKNFASLQERLEKQFPGKFQLLSVSIDPEFDRPEVLKNYASRWSKSEQNWTYGTGTREQTDAVGALFGLVQERAGGLINHDLRTALIAPDGKLVHVWKSNVWTPYEVQRRVQEVLNPQSDKLARRF